MHIDILLQPRQIQRGLLLAVSLCLWSCAASAAESASPASPERAAGAAGQSVDSACPWGRLADGKGRLLRCLTQSEAEKLRAESPAALPAPADGTTAQPAAPSVKPPAMSGVVPAEPPAGAPAPPSAEPAPEPVPSPGAGAGDGFTAEIGAVTPDQGALPDATKSLKKALDRFSQCVEKNGGLSADKGEAELRFLVQGRGRAEGVSVKKRRGMSEAAAKCIADVVDRRYVGTPEEPMVGATLQVVISKKKR